MIGWLQGIVIYKGADHVVVNVQGVGYQAFAHARLLANMSEGDAITLTIETHVREDHIHLFGFENAAEREWFRALTGVERVGAKVALAILGTLTPEQMLMAIMAKDTRAFTQVSGVGAKMGDRLVMELKDKALKLPVEASIMAASPSANNVAELITPKKKGGKKTAVKASATEATSNASLINDAASALVNLGYSRSEALTWVTGCLQDDTFENVDALITASLRKAS